LKKVLILFYMICALTQLSCAPDISWGTEVPLSASGVDSSDPQVVMDSNGNAVVAWVEAGVIKASYYDQMGMSWGTAQTLSGSSSSFPKLGVDSSGNVTAIWLDSTGVVNAATLPFGGSWSSATAVSASGAVTPRLVVDSTGNAIAVWQRSGFIETSTSLAGSGTWSLPSMVSGANSDNPDLAISDFGNAIIVWHTVVSGQDQILSSSVSTIGGTWGAAKTVIAAAFKNNYPKVTLDPSGNALAIWFRWVQITDATNVYVATAALAQGGTLWSAAIFISNVGLGDPANFTSRINSDGTGNIIATWVTSYDGSTFSIESAVHQNGQSFTTPNQVAIGNVFASKVDTSVNATGDTVIAYMFYDGTNILIQSVETLLSGALINFYTQPVNLSSNQNNAFPKVASTVTMTDINAAAAWLTYDGSNNIVVASNGSRSVVAPPTSPMAVQNTVNKNVLTEYENVITWTASTEPTVVAYGIFRNSVFVATVDSSTTTYTDYNQVNGGSVTYGISTITNDGAQSAVVTVSLP
jgi:hypothetical protein